MTFLVYTRGLFGPTPEKWPEMLFDMDGKPVKTLALHKLNEADATLSLDKLALKFPAPIQDSIQERPVHLGSVSRSNGGVA